jgi:hypothetical protein
MAGAVKGMWPAGAGPHPRLRVAPRKRRSGEILSKSDHILTDYMSFEKSYHPFLEEYAFVSQIFEARLREARARLGKGPASRDGEK